MANGGKKTAFHAVGFLCQPLPINSFLIQPNAAKGTSQLPDDSHTGIQINCIYCNVALSHILNEQREQRQTKRLANWKHARGRKLAARKTDG